MQAMNKDRFTHRWRKFMISLLTFEFVFWGLCIFLFYAAGIKNNTTTGNQFTFLTPAYAWLLILIYFGLIYQLRLMVIHQKRIKKLSPKIVHYLVPNISFKRSFIHYFFIRTALFFLVIALMQPSFGTKTITGKTNAAEVVFVLDISNSMNGKDMSGNTSRLDAAKRAIQQFAAQSKAGKFGIVVFAGNTFPHLPVTADKGALKMALSQINTSLMSKQGTDIGNALSVASDFFSNRPINKYIVLITDGEDHQGGIDASLEKLKEANISFLALGVGTSSGALIPIDPNNSSRGYIKDEDEHPIFSKLNLEMMKGISEKANGSFITSSDAFPNINALLTEINTSKSTKRVALKLEVIENHYVSFLMISMLLLISYISWQTWSFKQHGS